MKNLQSAANAASVLVAFSLIFMTSITLAQQDDVDTTGTPLNAEEIRAALVGKTHTGAFKGRPYSQEWDESNTTYRQGKSYRGSWKITDRGFYRSWFDWGMSHYKMYEIDPCTYGWLKVRPEGQSLNETYITTVNGCTN